jgi:spore germination protein YaaH
VPPDYYYKGYDLQKIGATADTVILMAYDFTNENSVLPSAPLPLVNDAVRRTLEHMSNYTSADWGLIHKEMSK